MKSMVDDIDVRVGCNLREIRTAAGLDIDMLASRTGLQPASLALFEAGRRRVPVDTLIHLAATFERPVEDFFV